MRGIGECLLVSSFAVSVLGIAVFFMLWEGVLCLIMAAPLVYILALMGSLLGYSLQKKKHLLAQMRIVLTLLMIILPLSMGADYADKAISSLCSAHKLQDIGTTRNSLEIHNRFSKFAGTNRTDVQSRL